MSHLTRSQQGGLIEGYPEDVRDHSDLIHGTSKHRRDIHVSCARKEKIFLAIITAYIPSRDELSTRPRERSPTHPRVQGTRSDRAPGQPLDRLTPLSPMGFPYRDVYLPKQFVYVLGTESETICMTREGDWEVVKAIVED